MVENDSLVGTVLIRDRQRFEMDGVDSVGTFDEDYLVLNTMCGKVCIEGAEMKIESLVHDTGKIIVVGRIDGISFNSQISKRGIRGLFS